MISFIILIGMSAVLAFTQITWPVAFFLIGITGGFMYTLKKAFGFVASLIRGPNVKYMPA